MIVQIKAWDDVVNPTTGKIHNEDGLRALDAIEYSEKIKVNQFDPQTLENLINEFKSSHQDHIYDHYDVFRVEEESL